MSTRGFSRLCGISGTHSENLTSSEWEERNSGGSLMLRQQRAFLDVLDFCSTVYKYANAKSYRRVWI